MADNNGAVIKAEAEDVFAVNSKKQRFVQGKNVKQSGSLVARCRAVVVANLERYPAEMFSMISEDDWEDILRSKHQKTAPLKGTGGLDGTGRRTPALSERFLSDVEYTNEHLAESSVADELVWKDCVEYQFSKKGLTRPRGLYLPWPVLVKQLTDAAAVLVEWKKKEDETEQDVDPLNFTAEEEKTITDAAQILKDSPMSLTLLKDSGIGKVLKKLIKASSNRTHISIFERIKMPRTGPMAGRTAGEVISVLEQLEKHLQSWMDLAASNGVDIQGGTGIKGAGKTLEGFKKDAEDLKLAEDCLSWKQLFYTLKERAEHTRESLGKKMRDNRQRENRVRPKIVKVRPLSSRKESILDKSAASSHTWGRGGGTIATHGGAKILSLRKEAAVQTAQSKGGLPTFKKQSGFGQAVAFASVTKLTATQKMHQVQDRKRKAAALVTLGNGKRMAVPAKEIRMHGTKFKKPSPKNANDSFGRR